MHFVGILAMVRVDQKRASVRKKLNLNVCTFLKGNNLDIPGYFLLVMN